jgi:hypothetical protein
VSRPHLVFDVGRPAPEQFVEVAIRRLQSGLPEAELVRDAAYAVAWGTEVPFGNLGGAVSVLSAVPAVLELTALGGIVRWDPQALFSLQLAAAANQALHSEVFAPADAPELEGSSEGADRLTAAALLRAAGRHQPLLAERLFVALWEDPHLAARTLVRVALGNYASDEAKLVLPVQTLRAAELLDPCDAPSLLRPGVRFNAYPDHYPRPEADELRLEQVAAALPDDPTAGAPLDPAGLAALREALREAGPGELLPVLAAALANEVSVRSVADAAALAACDRFLARESRNPLSVQALTGLESVRTAIEEYLATAESGRALLQWALGPETRSLWSHPLDAWIPSGSALSKETLEKDLLEAILAEDVDAAPELVLLYGDEGAEPAPVLRTLLKATARDGGTDLRGIQLVAAMIRQFRRLPDPYRWTSLAAAAREAALFSQQDLTVYDAATAAW